MPSIDITKTYADGAVLVESDLDNIIEDIETFLNVTQIDDTNIQDNGITASSKLVDGSISTAKLASSAITSAKITDLNVTTAKIADDAVTTAKILDSNVTTAKIADSNVTTAKIADGAVTGPKRVTTVQISSSSGSYSTASASPVDVTNLSVTITLTGRPVLVQLIAGSSAASSVSSATSAGTFIIKRDSTTVYTGALSTSRSYPPGAFSIIESGLAAAAYTYKVQVNGDSASTVSVTNCKLVAVEL